MSRKSNNPTGETCDERVQESPEDIENYEPMDAPWARLGHPDIPGYHTHWFNDVPGRIARAKRAGYQFVLKEEAPFLGDRPDDPSVREHLGSDVRTVVDKYENGEPIWGVLMKIPLRIYNHQQQGRDAQELEKLSTTARKGQQKDVPGKDELYVTGPGIKAGPRLE